VTIPSTNITAAFARDTFHHMSRLAVGPDDHPEAARKHIDDALALRAAGRHDGVAYHAGYVVECSLKAVLLHDRSYDPVTGAANPNLLVQWHRALSRRPFGHDLQRLLAAAVGPEGARYLPVVPPTASILNWTETLRYRATGAVTESTAHSYLSWAELAIDSVLQMVLDGVA
jgi:hypothetical protein